MSKCLAPAIDLSFQIALKNKRIFRSDFLMWLANNASIWIAFEQESSKIWARGRRHYSARTIIEIIRHESTLCEVRSDFKINNDSAPDMARLYGLMHPDRVGFFETRLQAGRERAA